MLIIARTTTVQTVLMNGNSNRSFQTMAPETGNARLPTVERRTGRTSRRCEVELRRPHAAVIWMSCRKRGRNTTVGRTKMCRGWIDNVPNCQFEVDAFWDAQPVKPPSEILCIRVSGQRVIRSTRHIWRVDLRKCWHVLRVDRSLWSTYYTCCDD